MPGSGAEPAARVLMLLAAIGKLGRLANLGSRTQTLSSVSGMLSILWPQVEVLQPGGNLVRKEGKIQFSPTRPLHPPPHPNLETSWSLQEYPSC